MRTVRLLTSLAALSGMAPPVPAAVLEDAAVTAAAREVLVAWLAPRASKVSLTAVSGNATVEVPEGAVTLVPRPLMDSDQLAPRMQLWVDVNVGGRRLRTVPVSFDVHAWQHAWVATRDVRAGASLAEAALERREVDLTAQRGVPSAEPAASARLRRPLLAGQFLTAAHVEPLPEVQRGASIALRMATGAIAVESRAEALQDGRTGQVVWVRAPSSTGPVKALVTGAGVVEVQP